MGDAPPSSSRPSERARGLPVAVDASDARVARRDDAFVPKITSNYLILHTLNDYTLRVLYMLGFG